MKGKGICGCFGVGYRVMLTQKINALTFNTLSLGILSCLKVENLEPVLRTQGIQRLPKCPEIVCKFYFIFMLFFMGKEQTTFIRFS